METIFSPSVLAKAPEVDYRFLTEAAKVDPLSFEFDELFKATKGNRDRLELELAAKKHEYEMAEIQARSDASLALLAGKKLKEVKDTEDKLTKAEATKKALSESKVATTIKKFREEYPTPDSIFAQSFDFAEDALDTQWKPIKDAYDGILALDPTGISEPELNKRILAFQQMLTAPEINRAINDWAFLKKMDGKSGYNQKLVSYGMNEFRKDRAITYGDDNFYKITGDELTMLDRKVKTLVANAFSENTGVEKVVGGEADVTRRNLNPNGLETAAANLLADPIVGKTILKMSIESDETPERTSKKLVDIVASGVKLMDPGVVRKDQRPGLDSDGSDSPGLTDRENQNMIDSKALLGEQGYRIVSKVPGSVWPKIGAALVTDKPIRETSNGPVFNDPDLAGIKLEKIGGTTTQSTQSTQSTTKTYTVPGSVVSQMKTNVGVTEGTAKKIVAKLGGFKSEVTKVSFEKTLKGDTNPKKKKYRLKFHTKNPDDSKAMYYDEMQPGWKLSDPIE